MDLIPAKPLDLPQLSPFVTAEYQFHWLFVYVVPWQMEEGVGFAQK